MHSSLLETDARASEVLQPHPSVLGVEAYPVGRTIRPLAAPLQMAREAFAHIAVDRPEGDARVPEREVVRPPFQMSIQLFNQRWEEGPTAALTRCFTVDGRLYRSLAGWPPPPCVTRPNRVRVCYGSRVRRARLRRWNCSHPALAWLLAERVIYKVNSFQFTRSARLTLAHQRHRGESVVKTNDIFIRSSGSSLCLRASAFNSSHVLRAES